MDVENTVVMQTFQADDRVTVIGYIRQVNEPLNLFPVAEIVGRVGTVIEVEKLSADDYLVNWVRLDEPIIWLGDSLAEFPFSNNELEVYHHG
jgi:hypothetical protein